MKRILIVNTGGTFGMVEGPLGLEPSGDLEARIMDLVEEATDFNFSVLDLDPLIDSSDLAVTDWSRILTAIADNRNDYGAFLIIHGTDTLAYTSSMLSFALRGFDKPVAVTGSQYPLGTEGSDAETNLVDSLHFLTRRELPGVSVCFGGKLLQGNRVRKVDAQGLEAFACPNGLIKSAAVSDESASALFENLPTFKPGSVATLLIYPGIPASQVDALLADNRLEAIILLSFGSGNIPMQSSDLAEGLKRAANKGVLLVNMTQCQRGRVVQGAYATGSLLVELGALNGFDMTPEAAFAKLHYLLATGDKKAAKTQWSQPLCGEF